MGEDLRNEYSERLSRDSPLARRSSRRGGHRGHRPRRGPGRRCPGAGILALITLDNGHDHTKPNTFGPRGLLSLNAALDEIAPRAAAGEIAAVGVTGKPFILAVGADLDGGRGGRHP